MPELSTVLPLPCRGTEVTVRQRRAHHITVRSTGCAREHDSIVGATGVFGKQRSCHTRISINRIDNALRRVVARLNSDIVALPVPGVTVRVKPLPPFSDCVVEVLIRFISARPPAM